MPIFLKVYLFYLSKIKVFDVGLHDIFGINIITVCDLLIATV